MRYPLVIKSCGHIKEIDGYYCLQFIPPSKIKNKIPIPSADTKRESDRQKKEHQDRLKEGKTIG